MSSTAIMKRFLVRAILAASIPASAQQLASINTQSPMPAVQDQIRVASTNYSVTQRGANHRVWSKLEWHTNHAGRAIAHTNSYTELATGMARQKGGSWIETTTDIWPTDGGAAATNTGHQVFFAVNPNVSEALRLTMPDGKVLSSHVLCLSYLDTSTGSNAVIGELHDSTGQITDSNKVVYPGALQGDLHGGHFL
jgi:hypothetical protein